MYTPEFYQLTDLGAILAIIRAHNFGTLVTNLQATHLAFTSEMDEENTIILTGHIAKGNPQAQQMGSEALAIFQGPHGYISPSLYLRTNSVPTWNYVAVHVYGTLELVPKEAHFQIVETLIQEHEPQFLEQWEALPYSYKNGLSNGIVAFKMRVNKIEAALKLSQDRTFEERISIIEHLRSSEHSNDHDLADWMDRALT